jgi:hypothetical protein
VCSAQKRRSGTAVVSCKNSGSSQRAFLRVDHRYDVNVLDIAVPIAVDLPVMRPQ